MFIRLQLWTILRYFLRECSTGDMCSCKQKNEITVDLAVELHPLGYIFITNKLKQIPRHITGLPNNLFLCVCFHKQNKH